MVIVAEKMGKLRWNHTRQGEVSLVTDPDKNALTDRDICTKFITPAVKRAG
jgi:hypothetical protein